MVRPQGNKYPSCLLQPCGHIAVARVDFFAFRNFSNTCVGGDLSLSVEPVPMLWRDRELEILTSAIIITETRSTQLVCYLPRVRNSHIILLWMPKIGTGLLPL
jgi:hypothetical protein